MLTDRLGRYRHQEEAGAILNQHFGQRSWKFAFPQGNGCETYFAHSPGFNCFIKLGAPVLKYQAAAVIGLTPGLIGAGSLMDGTSFLIQPYISGKSPSRKDYRDRLGDFAASIRRLHHSSEMIAVLPPASSHLFRDAGLEALTRLQEKWELHRSRVSHKTAAFISESLQGLRLQTMAFEGSGLVASHNDICNANWIIAENGQLYLVDLDAVTLDDPAVDLGATLWWYYPPELRESFLQAAGYSYDASLKNRMRVRMAMHCLNILLPREHSFDAFDTASFEENLVDFKAAFAGLENPQGYD